MSTCPRARNDGWETSHRGKRGSPSPTPVPSSRWSLPTYWVASDSSRLPTQSVSTRPFFLREGINLVAVAQNDDTEHRSSVRGVIVDHALQVLVDTRGISILGVVGDVEDDGHVLCFWPHACFDHARFPHLAAAEHHDDSDLARGARLRSTISTSSVRRPVRLT
ncbi:unnamed protein product [Symbiodinium sp. CCMP2592]|nr:unnamed protein product [Symbiodinium sp. CCMP2592]